MQMEEPAISKNIRDMRLAQLAPYQWKKGQSGNILGRPTDTGKAYLAKKIRAMTDEEKEEFFEGMNKIDIFKMAEGNPETKTDITSGGKPILQISEDVANKHAITPDTKDSSEITQQI